jgi:uncharacterized protein (DUF433 family)
VNEIVQNPEILGGTPVFRGTRVPIQTLFDYLEGGETLDDFLQGFPTVTRESAVAALEAAKDLLLARSFPVKKSSLVKLLPYVPLIAALLSLAAISIPAFSAKQAYNSVLIASAPVLYGECNQTTTELLPAAGPPDVILMGSSRYQNTFVQFFPASPAPPKVDYNPTFSFAMPRCVLTNLGKGVAVDIRLDLNVTFVDNTQPPEKRAPATWHSGTLKIRVLAPGAKFVFVISDDDDSLAAIVQPSKKISYRLATDSKSVTENVLHNALWDELAVDRRRLTPAAIPEK